jgi:hypothetical protein
MRHTAQIAATANNHHGKKFTSKALHATKDANKYNKAVRDN